MVHHALGVSGAFASVLLIHLGNKEKPFKFVGTMIGLGISIIVIFIYYAVMTFTTGLGNDWTAGRSFDFLCRYFLFSY